MKRSSDHVTEWWEEKTRSLRSGHPPRVELCVRSLTPPVGVCKQQDDLIERLQTFERQGVLDSLAVTVWGKAVSPDSQCGNTDTGRGIMDRLDSYRSWEPRVDASVTDPFQEETVSSSITGEQFRKVVLPRVCLGIHAEDELELVLPYDIDDVAFRIADFLAAFEPQKLSEQGIGTSA